MDSPATYPESPMEQDDTPYPCKGCGEILEEGKAFELAGNRWHIDCFRCNTCGTLLDSDANLLLLGDGSLICNNCTYSCSSCGNKIEDLAILTGDQAFCASCFRCRNCKKKIENLRYARTSQGIFCMDCHESLMARRRKKTARNNAQRQKPSGPGVQLDKSLPSLPPSALTAVSAPKSAFSPDVETPPSDTYSDTPTEIPSRYRSQETRSELSKKSRRDGSPASQTQGKDTLTLPSTTYKNNRHSIVSNKSDLSGAGDGEFLIPLAFDPTPPVTQSARTNAVKKEERPRDYFGHAGARSPYGSRKTSQDTKGHLQEKESDQGSQPSSPHIAYQEKGRQPSEMVESIRRRKEGTTSAHGSTTASPIVGNTSRTQSPQITQMAKESPATEEKFKLQDAPKHRKSSHSRKNSKSSNEKLSPRVDTSGAIFGSNSDRSPMLSQDKDSLRSTPTEMTKNSIGTSIGGATLNGSGSPRRSHESRNREDSFDSVGSKSSPQAAPMTNPPKRGDSLDKMAPIPRKEVGASSALKSSQLVPDNASDFSTPSPTLTQEAPSPRPKVNGTRSISKPIESPNSKSIFDTVAPLGHSRTDSAMSTPKESFTAPRAPPPPPPFDLTRPRNEPVSTTHSELSRVIENQISPTLPRYSAGGEFTLEEDMARILGTEESLRDQESFLRRVSNSVRHGRSYSDKGTRLSKEPKWPKSPMNGSVIGQEISSPITASPEHRNELPWYKNEVLRQGQTIVEKDQKIAELEAVLNATVDIKQVNTELREKRSTMIILDTQKEMVVRELEILTDYIAATKTTGEPLDLGRLNNGVLRDFAESLQKLKDSFAPQIEDLIQKKIDLIEENSNLSKMKDTTLQEFEQLSSKNAQLAELNNQLVHQIQELYKANSGPTLPAANGLGIYSNHSKASVSVDSREMRPALNDTSLGTSQASIHQDEAEPVTVLQGPHVVNIRKGQPKKFNWKKGGHNVAKGVTKGLKGAFSSGDQKYQREGGFAETMPYGALTGGETPTSGASFPRSTTIEPGRQGFGFFGNPKSGPNKSGPFKSHFNGSSPQLVSDAPPAASASTLFGSDLEQRVEFERTTIPSIVIRCIEEVELRGMDVEGIYRKSGGNSQILMVKEGLERSPHDYDISDPDLDIHTITSALKQYFRRLPSPLITYEVYDEFLESNTLAPDPAARIDALRAAVGELPRAHRDVLEFLVFHLKRVVEREKENKMTSLNVAVVFAPTIMRPESVTREMTDTQAKNQAVQFLVENCHSVFMSE